LFKPGDEVWYAGSRTRQGANAELQLVDERIVGRKPKTLNFAQAAALPLTTITAWEALFDRLQLTTGRPPGQGTLLITAGAGGVGSIAIQLAKQLTSAFVVATASRPESRAHAQGLGADLVIDHSKSISEQLASAGIRWVERIFSVSHTDTHYAELAKSIAPFGRLCIIDETGPIDVRLLKPRSASLHWEGMFARSGFGLEMEAQGGLLNEVSGMVDAGQIRTTHSKTMGTINAANLRAAHAAVESNRTIGKVVLEGF
jgi:zinc-binding alcohol dehydrogenase family protein